MEGLFPPMALYAVLAVSVALTAKAIAEGARGTTTIRSWEPWLVYAPVFAAWLHILGYLFWRLFLADLPSSGFSRLNVIIHGVTLILAGLAGSSIFKKQLASVSSGTTRL